MCVCVCGGGQLNLTTINELFSARKLTFSMHNCTYKLDNRREVTQSNYRVHQHVHYIAILCTGNCRQLCNYDNYSAASVPEYCDCWSESIEGSLAYDQSLVVSSWKQARHKRFCKDKCSSVLFSKETMIHYQEHARGVAVRAWL